METAKKEVKKILSHLPDDCSLEDIQYHLYVLQKVEKGLKEAKSGHLHHQAKVEARIKEWLKK